MTRATSNSACPMPFPILTVWSALFAVCGTSACEPTLTPSGFDAQALDIGSGDATGLGGDATATGGASDMNGTWVLVTDWSTCVELGDRTELRNYTISKVEITQESTVLREVREDCSLVNTALVGLVTVVPQVALASGNPMHTTSFISGVGPGQIYLGGPEAQLWGLKFNDPLGEAMPSDANDPRVKDPENDGHPGVTLKVGGMCDLYAVQRAVMVRSGTQLADGSIQGEGGRNIAQVPFGASQGFCATPFATTSNTHHNRWRMLRVDQKGLNLDANSDGKVSCEEILQNSASVALWVEPDGKPPTSWLEPDDTRCALPAVTP